MRVLNWALESQKTVLGKIISVILSLALVFSCSAFFYNRDAFAVEDEQQEEFTEQVNDTPATSEDNSATDITQSTDQPSTAPEADMDADEEESVTDLDSSSQENAAGSDSSDVASTTNASSDRIADDPAEDDAVVEGEAATFEGYAKVDEVTVKVTADSGVVPEGTTVKAANADTAAVKEAVESTLENNGKSLGGYKAIDVTLFDAKGNEMQPNGNVNVCFFGTNLEGGEISVYHVSDDAASVTPVNTRQADANVQSFDVSHFSIYVTAQNVQSNNLGTGKEKDISKYSVSKNDRVYVFVKFLDDQERSSLGIEKGAQGVYGSWITIGYIDLKDTGYSKPQYDSVIGPNGYQYKYKYENNDLTKAILTNDWIHSDRFQPLHEGKDYAAYLALNGIVGYKAFADGNAEGYSSEKEKITWHMNFEVPYSVTYTSGTTDEVSNLPTDSKRYSSGAIVNVATNQPTRDGYAFTGWKVAQGEVTLSNDSFAMGSSNVVLEAQWKPVTYTVTVNYVDEQGDTLKDAYVSDPIEHGTEYDVSTQKAQSIDKDGTHYVLDAIEGELSADAITGNVTIKLTYAEDKIGTTDPTEPDEVADKHQAKIVYAAEGNGSVNPEGENVVTLMDGDDYAASESFAANSVFPVTAKAVDGYSLSGWTLEVDGVAAQGNQSPSLVTLFEGGKTYTFTAHFAKRTDLSYQVHYFYDGVEDTGRSASTNNATFDTEIPYRTDGEYLTYNNENYVLDRVDGIGKKVTTTAENNVVSVYFDKDVVVDLTVPDPDPTKPGDGIADKYQAVITYASANNAQGTVGGTTARVVTLVDSDGNYATSQTITPGIPARMTLAAAAGYTANGWDRNPSDELEVKGGQTYTYYAQWAAVPAPVVPTTPTPTPVTPTTPTPAVVTPPAPAPAAAPADAPAVTIPDDETPMAEPEEEQIADDETPMAAFDTPHCWVHYLMYLGILLTVIYGLGVVLHRLGYARKIDDFENDVLGIEGTPKKAKHSAGAMHHA